MRNRLFEIALGCGLAIATPTLAAERNAGGFNCALIVEDVIRSTKENRGGIINAELLIIEEVSTTSDEKDRLECRGVGIWTNASKGPIRFFAYEKYGEWKIDYQPE